MRTRCRRSVEIVVACWLIVMASGDDFNVARIIIPMLPSNCPPHALPLDDPNTDFTKSDDSQTLQAVQFHYLADAMFFNSEPPSTFALVPLLSPYRDPCPDSHRLRRSDGIVRLRC